MKPLLRTSAALSFGFFLASGLLLLSNANLDFRESGLLVAMGLIFIGMAFFAGGILLFAAERFDRKGRG